MASKELTKLGSVIGLLGDGIERPELGATVRESCGYVGR